MPRYKPTKDGKIRDWAGHVVPDCVRWAFTKETEDAFDSLLNGVCYSRQMVEDADRDEPAYAKLDFGMAMEAMGAAYQEIENARPWSVCPYCRGEGGGCKCCLDRGWVTKPMWDVILTKDRFKIEDMMVATKIRMSSGARVTRK